MALPALMAQTSLDLTASSKDNQDKEFMRQFGAVLTQLKVGNIAPLALSVRQNMEAQETTEQTDPNRPTDKTDIGCKVSPEPLRGSYNLAYRISFDDGVEWILKVPANGCPNRFDRVAADAMTSEALTMRMIKQSTTIPVPAVHSFDITLDNDLGCPFILMDFLKGRPLYEGWFDVDISGAKREQFRARALQTIAAAMVQLDAFKLDSGGALRFDSNGQPVGVAGAKVPDGTTFHDCINQGSFPAHDIWCENGPTTDPSSYLLFHLNRRGHREEDSLYIRGVHESARLFAKWVLELSAILDRKEKQFVLAHPDFDIQNILVLEDGTLSGILDWDGVAAVPLSMGCLRYPLWLTRDSDAREYNWNIETHEPKSCSGRLDNAPDELSCYRARYAQFIETLLSIDLANGRTGKTGADITRLSLITANLEIAVNRPWDTRQVIGKVFRELEQIVREKGDSDLSGIQSSGSGFTSGLSDIGDSSTGAAVCVNDVQSEDCDEKAEPTKISGDKKQTQHSIAGLPNSALEHVSTGYCAIGRPALNVAPCDEPGCGRDGGSEMPLSDHLPAKDAARDEQAPGSHKLNFMKRALDLGEKGAQGIANALRKKEPPASKLPRKIRMVKWALVVGEKGCKAASEAFHKGKELSIPRPKDRRETAPTRQHSQLAQKLAKAAMCLCDQTEILLRKIIDRMHRNSAPGAEDFDLKETETQQIRTLIEWLITLFKKTVPEPVKDVVELPNVPTTAERQLQQNQVLVDTKYNQICDRGEKNSREEANNGIASADLVSEDVWVCIAADIEKRGIPIDLIKKRHDMIVQCVVENLGEETVREKEEVLYLENKDAVIKAKTAKKQTKLTNTNHGSSPDPTQHQLAKTEAAYIGLSEGGCADVADGKASTTHQIIAAPIVKVDGDLGQELEKPKPQITARTDDSIVAWKGSSADAVDAQLMRPLSDIYKSPEPESLISKLEAAKQRFDMEMALKEQISGSSNLVPGATAPMIQDVGDINQIPSTRDPATPDAAKEANQKLRMMLSNLANTQFLNHNQDTITSENAEDGGITTAHLIKDKSATFDNDTTFSEAINVANEKLKTILSGLQEPVAAYAKLQPSMFRISQDDDEEFEGKKGSRKFSIPSMSVVRSRNVVAQMQKAVKAGRWFETPRGNLKRIEDDEKVKDGLNDQEVISPLSSCFSEESKGSSETSMATQEIEAVAKVSDDHTLFPNHPKTGIVNSFQTPYFDEEAEDEIEGGSVGGFTRDNNGEECEELEEGEVPNPGSGLLEVMQGSREEKDATSEPPGGEDLGHPGPEKTLDHGHFTMSEVCVALGNGDLDEERMRVLESGFKMMIAEALGKI